MTGAPARRATADEVFRIRWLPGSDELLAVCFCGADRVFDDPVELWDWLLAHPGHRREPAAGAAAPGPAAGARS
ncbi:hypothetical protein [Streptomyces tremellae]|uniref:Uncharacterized protein n=1 Tax=Streptomyces tremellae TaxID=1124239 RepID=A0ABP7EQ28_9ACTN